MGTYDHSPFQVDKETYLVRELSEGTDSIRVTYNLVRARDGMVLNEQPYKAYPTDEEVAEALQSHDDVYLDWTTCKFCGGDILQTRAHLHQGEWVGDAGCWDDRLSSTA
ncbi:hypothetical protein GCM10027168_11780 [Streptomyces capparidis]